MKHRYKVVIVSARQDGSHTDYQLADKWVEVCIHDRKEEMGKDVPVVIINRLVQNSFAASMRFHGNSELASVVDIEGFPNTGSPGLVVASGYNFERGVIRYE